MKTGAGLLLIGVGAILAFAVTTNTSVFNLHTAGYVIMLVGVLGLALPRRAASWAGRRLFVRQTRPGGRAGNITRPRYVHRNPANAQVRAGLPPGTGDPTPAGTQGETEVTEDIYEE
jgi:hypothetical protein